jgi:phage terminase large subunit-like protein
VLDQALTHDGDPRLARHVANCVVKPSPQGDVITKADKDSPAKIDLAVAATIAYQAAASARPARGGLFVV